jgi:Holliday junction DNA helicase RuvA
MISKLVGIVDSIYSDYLLLMTSGGVGYQIFTPVKILTNLIVGEKAELYIETIIKDENILLFGFNSINTRRAFNLLKTVSGIGPKMSLNILNYFTPQDLQGIINAQDKASFKMVSGVGLKTAERIILELKNKNICLEFEVAPKSNAASALNVRSSHIEDAMAALISLGMNKNDVINIINNITASGEDYSTEELIKLALQFRKL